MLVRRAKLIASILKCSTRTRDTEGMHLEGWPPHGTEKHGSLL